MADLKHKTHLFFDLDDTLWDFEKNSGLVLQQLFSEFELEHKLKVPFEVFIEAYKKTNLQFWSNYYKKRIDKTYLRNHRFNETFKLFNYNNYDENLLITEAYLQRSPKGTLLKEGCIEILEYLKPNYQLHIITNGFKEVQDIKLQGSGLKHYFSTVIISEEHHLVKPEPAIFRLAEHLSGAQKEHCVMIGDNFESDITGAMGAEWTSIHLAQESPLHYTGYNIKKLLELKQLF